MRLHPATVTRQIRPRDCHPTDASPRAGSFATFLLFPSPLLPPLPERAFPPVDRMSVLAHSGSVTALTTLVAHIQRCWHQHPGDLRGGYP